MELIERSVQEFIAITASNAPAPGGGSVSALAGTLASALSQMVANLTLGRQKYAQVQEDMEKALPLLEEAHRELLLAIDADSRAFDLYMAALGMPKGTDEEKALRKQAMEDGLKAAVAVPLSVAQRVESLLPVLETVLAKGNANAVTDGLVSVMMARTGILGALYNVRVNLASISDEAFVQDHEAICRRIQDNAVAWELRVMKQYPLTGF